MTNSKFHLPKKSITYLIIYAGIIIIIALIGIVPMNHYISKINSKIDNINYQIKEQEDLGPKYIILVKSLGNKEDHELSYPKRVGIPRDQAGKFQDEFRAIAGKSKMMTVSLTPDLTTLTGDSLYLLHNAVVKGEFINFRDMLIGLGSVPYLDRIDEILIQQYPDTMEYRMKIWIELGK